MGGEWELAPLVDLVEVERGISYGIVQPGPAVEAGVPIVRVSDVRNGRISTTAPLRVSPEIEAAYSRTRLKGGELLLTLVGTVGETAIVPKALAGWNTARAVAVIPVRKEVGPYWVQIALCSPELRERIGSRVNTTVQTTLNLRDVAQLPIVLPPQKEREAIVHILGTLDDKIELSRRMNETLEAMARALFKSWFVDFDPVREKSEFSGLSSRLLKLFPDSFQETKLGNIPTGWEVKSIGELAEVVGGSTPSTKVPRYWDSGGNHWVTPKDLSGLSTPILVETERCITDAGLLQIGSGLLPVGTVLLSSRAPIGYLAITEIPVAINQGFIAMKPINGVSSLFLWLWASFAHADIVSRANGSTFLEISKASFRPIPVCTPPQGLMDAFDGLVRPLYGRMLANVREIKVLTGLRDELLPKLLCGEIRVGVR
ncbi:restriction endonuclease subunit S [Rhodopseudomonas sp. NSM]|uniref:restriction endonuclease subunit S n=1 Tax=Rhodopseudomonas sp. NSM TaxID=3457630 RepID=UPI0040359EBE